MPRFAGGITIVVAGLTTDVLVLGAGASGMAAAIESAGAGASTLVLEKAGQTGGSSRLSVGSINAAGSSLQKRAGIVDTPDEHYADMELLTGAYASRENHALRRLLVDEAAGTLEWLIGLGVCFSGPTADPPHRHARMHNIVPNSRAYPLYMERELRRQGARILLNARATALLQDADGDVCGATAVVDGRTVDIRARRGVVIAAGDYSNGPAVKGRFRPEIAGIPGVNPGATGDGHCMGEAAGAAFVNGDVVYGPSLRFCEPAKPPLLRRLPPSRVLGIAMQLALRHLPMSLFRPVVMSFMTASLGPEASLLRAGAILVNRHGERFVDELGAPGLAIASQPEGRAWLVFDQRLANIFSAPPHAVSTAPGVAFAYLGDYRRHRKDLYHRASDIEALALGLAMPALALRRSVEDFCRAPGERKPWAGGPFYALGPLESRVVITDGGLAVDGDHRVLRADGSVIGRLYAAGAAGQGGLLLAGNGHHLCWAVTSGRRAGLRAARESAAA